MKNIFIILFVLTGFSVNAQTAYFDSMSAYQHQYLSHHPVVSGSDSIYFSFYPINKNMRVTATVEKKENSPWFKMVTSGMNQPLYRVYGIIHFVVYDRQFKLNLYQSQSLLGNEEYKNYLFLPFTDETSGKGSYVGGRYIDITFEEIHDGKVIIDFNKAYNPYCAYVSGKYNCPIPPKENNLPVKIQAGEKMFLKH
jgi:uncharacterized protein